MTHQLAASEYFEIVSSDGGTVRIPNKASGTDYVALVKELGYALVDKSIPEGGSTSIQRKPLMANRSINRVVVPADNTEAVTIRFPTATATPGYSRDFLVMLTNTEGNTGAISFGVAPSTATVYGDGLENAIPGGKTWLYRFTELASGAFYAKAVELVAPAAEEEVEEEDGE